MPGHVDFDHIKWAKRSAIEMQAHWWNFPVVRGIDCSANQIDYLDEFLIEFVSSVNINSKVYLISSHKINIIYKVF